MIIGRSCPGAPPSSPASPRRSFGRLEVGASVGGNLEAGPLAWLGQHSLALYLIHQPLLFGLFAALVFVGAAPSDRSSGGFVGACVAQCEASGGGKSVCREACACIAERAASEELPTEAKARARRLDEFASDCLAKEY